MTHSDEYKPMGMSSTQNITYVSNRRMLLHSKAAQHSPCAKPRNSARPPAARPPAGVPPVCICCCRPPRMRLLPHHPCCCFAPPTSNLALPVWLHAFFLPDERGPPGHRPGGPASDRWAASGQGAGAGPGLGGGASGRTVAGRVSPHPRRSRRRPSLFFRASVPCMRPHCASRSACSTGWLCPARLSSLLLCSQAAAVPGVALSCPSGPALLFRPAGSSRMFNWVDYDGTATQRKGPSIVGSWPAWWQLAPDCAFEVDGAGCWPASVVRRCFLMLASCRVVWWR